MPIGMDLFISKSIIETFGGKLDFHSEKDIGSTFVFSFDIEIEREQENQRRIGSPRF